MIPIRESVTNDFVVCDIDSIKKIIYSDDFVNYVKDMYDDFDASIDIALAINTLTKTAVARPVTSDVYIDDRLVNSIFIDFNNTLYDILDKRTYTDLAKSLITFKRSDKRVVSPSEYYWKLVDFIKTKTNEVKYDV